MRIVRAWSAIDAGDRLADPPRRIGRELVAAAVFELIDRLHQADVAFLNEIKELQAAVGVFLGDRNHQAQVGLDHFFLRAAGFFFALLDLLDDAAEFRDVDADIWPTCAISSAQFLDSLRSTFSMTSASPPAFQPIRSSQLGIKFIAAIFFDELAAVDPRLVGEFHHVPYRST